MHWLLLISYSFQRFAVLAKHSVAELTVLPLTCKQVIWKHPILEMRLGSYSNRL